MKSNDFNREIITCPFVSNSSGKEYRVGIFFTVEVIGQMTANSVQRLKSYLDTTNPGRLF
ncbi:hypothetical protein GCM10019994_35650 [Enterococcus raffinosus]